MISVKELFKTKSVKKILEDSENLSDGHESAGLHKHLGVKDLTSFGIAAVIGAGIFSTIVDFRRFAMPSLHLEFQFPVALTLILMPFLAN